MKEFEVAVKRAPVITYVGMFCNNHSQSIIDHNDKLLRCVPTDWVTSSSTFSCGCKIEGLDAFIVYHKKES